MEYVLTTASSVSCDHPSTGGGAVTLVATQNVLKVDGNAVLVGNLSGATIAPGCSQVATGQNICSTVTSQTQGPSTVLKVNGVAVLLENSAGTTNGTPDQAWSAKDASQSVLRAD